MEEDVVVAGDWPEVIVARDCSVAEADVEIVTLASEGRPEMKVATLVGKGELEA